MDTMMVARLLEPRRFELTETTVPEPGRGQVLIRVRACGLCTSDLYGWRGSGKVYPFVPGAPGHEVYGTVAATGEGVEGLSPGDTVTAIAFPGRGYAEYIVADAVSTALVENGHGTEAVLGEPIACAVNAMRRSGVRPGDSVLLLGAGYMGALALQILRNMGAAPLMAADVRAQSRDLAKRLGADVVLDPSSADFVEQVLQHSDGKGADVVVEATGAQGALDLIPPVVAIRGTVVIYGYHVGGPRSLDMQQWNYKGLNVVNGHERDPAVYTQGMRLGLRLLRYGKIAQGLVTHVFKLRDINSAFTTADEKPDGFIKAIVQPVAEA